MNLESVLAYRNDDVVHRFADDQGLSFEDANEIFTETKRWLWLCAKKGQEVKEGRAEFFAIPLFDEAYAIDLMWHTFILFTQDYFDFCETYFGGYIHHQPKPWAEKQAWRARLAADPEKAMEERHEHLRKVYSHFYDELGPEILIRWCEEFPTRFPLSRPSMRA